MYIHINDRSKLDRIVCYDPTSDKSFTLLEDLERHNSTIIRTDIVLINDTRSHYEYSLHVTRMGFAGDTWILDILSDRDYQYVQNIANAMRANAKAVPAARKLLV